LITDASRLGLGYILTQENEAKELKLITCGSRFLTDAERNYAVIELECMAIQWAILKCRNYLLGVTFKVKTDHKPLLGVINGKDLDAVNNLRLQRILSKLLGFQFTVEYVPGKLNEIADALSRSPVFQPEIQDQEDVLVQALAVKVEPLDPQVASIVEMAASCAEYQELVRTIQHGRQLAELPVDHPARGLYRNVFHTMAYEPSIGLLTIHNKIVVPKEARKQVLKSLHIQHTGVVKTQKNANQLYYWPGMKNDIAQLIGNCQECIALLPSRPKEPCIQTTAERPFEAMSADLGMLNGTSYLIAVDRYSGWPLVSQLRKLETSAITKVFEEWFLEYGRPLTLRTDNGPQFRSEFDEWCEKMGIIHEKSSPEHHESNGHAECAVKEMKKLLEKTGSWTKFRPALLEWRNTPRVSDGFSPAQWALGRRQRTSCPALPSAYARINDDDLKKASARREEMKEKAKVDFDGKRRHLAGLEVGDNVYCQDFKTKRWNRKGTIIQTTKKNRSYLVDIDGKKFWRNSKFLRKDPGDPDDLEEADDPVADPPEGPEADRNTPKIMKTPEVPQLRRSTRKKKKTRKSLSTF